MLIDGRGCGVGSDGLGAFVASHAGAHERGEEDSRTKTHWDSVASLSSRVQQGDQLGFFTLPTLFARFEETVFLRFQAYFGDGGALRVHFPEPPTVLDPGQYSGGMK